MTITALPTPPSRDDAANFSDRADAFLAALPTFAVEANELADDVNDDAAAAATSAAAAAASATAADDSADAAAASAAAAATFVPADYVAKSLLTAAEQIIVSTGVSTPAALAVAASRFVGRKSAGSIAAMTAAEARTVLGLATTDAPAFAGASLTGDLVVQYAGTPGTNVIARNISNNAGGSVLTIQGTALGIGQAVTAAFSAVTGTGWSATAAAAYFNKDATTNRSLNCAGSVGASGADVAETKWKAADCATVAKGQVCGLDGSGKITDRWSAMKLPRWKTGLLYEPAIVMADDWGSAEAICVLDGMPLGERPAAPAAPDPEDAEAVAAYNADHAAYEIALAAWKPRIEANRERIDRLVYCGTNGVRLEERQGERLPEAGDYIVLVEVAGEHIGWIAVAQNDLSFGQSHYVIGRVERVEADGVPLVAAKL